MFYVDGPSWSSSRRWCTSRREWICCDWLCLGSI